MEGRSVFKQLTIQISKGSSLVQNLTAIFGSEARSSIRKKAALSSFKQIINSVISELKEVQKINKNQHYYKFSRWNMEDHISVYGLLEKQI